MLVENIERLRKLKKLTQKELAAAAGMSVTNYNNMVNHNKDFWYSDVVKMAKALKVPVTALIMSVREPDESVVGEPAAEYNTPHLLPLLDSLAQAGSAKGFSDRLESHKSIMIPDFSDCDFAVKISGDSMADEYNSGDVLVCKILEDKTRFMWGRAYAVSTAGGIQIKIVVPGPEESKVSLESYNEKYRPIQVPKKAILAMALVRGVIKDKGQ